MDLTPYKNCNAHKNGVYISNDEESYRPCCWFKSGISAVSFSEYQNKLQKLDIEYNCQHCIKQESQGATWSHRHTFNDANEFVIGVCFDNICNLKCVTCSPHHSSQLIKEWDILGKIDKEEKRYFTRMSKQGPGKLDFVKDALLANSDFKKFRIDIFGGEPLINPFVFDFLDWISEQSFADRTYVGITTNGTTYSEKIKTYTEKFNFIGIQLSVDGMEDSFEYLRFGADWKKANEVLGSYYSLIEQYPTKISVGINYTLSWMNCLHFGDFYNWIRRSYPMLFTHLTKLESPEVYSVNLLSNEIRRKIVKRVEATISGPPVSGQFNKLWYLYKESMLFNGDDFFNKELLEQGIKRLESQETIRGNDHKKVFSEILEILK